MGAQAIEQNVLKLVKELLEEGKYLGPMLELGEYACLCELLLELMPNASSRALRAKMLQGLRNSPTNKSFDDLLKRGLDVPPQHEQPSQHPQEEIADRAACPPLKFGLLDPALDTDASDDLPEWDALPEYGQPSQHPQEEIADRAACPPLEFGLLDPTLAQDASPWLDEFVAFSRQWSPRSPDIHHIAVGLWLQSTICLGRVAAVDGGLILPSLYIQLVAPSSVWAKTTVARNGRGLLDALGLGWMVPVDRASPEKFLSSMSGTVPRNYGELTLLQQEEIRQEVALSGKRSWYYSEFRGMLRDISQERGRNAEFKEILLQMADGERYRTDTHSRGREEISHPYLALLATMTPDCMKMYERREMSALWTDGFYPRMLFACTLFEIKKTREDLQKQRLPSAAVVYPESLLDPLREVHEELGFPECVITEVLDAQGKRTGIYKAEKEECQIRQMHMTPSAKESLDDYGDALLLAVQDAQYSQVQAWYARLRTKCLQIATSLALIQGHSMIKLKHIARAQQLCEMFRESLHKLVAYLNDENPIDKPSPEQKILNLLAKKGPLTVREVGQFMHLEGDSVRKKLEGLTKDGEIAVTMQGRKMVYFVINE